MGSKGSLGSSINKANVVAIDEDAPDLGNLSNNALGPLDQSFVDNASLQPDPDGSLPPPPEVSPPLIYEDQVTPVWPVAGAVK